MKKEYDVIISLASNVNQKANLEQARQLLSGIVHNPKFTQEKWTEPINTSCKNLYLNQLCKGSIEVSSDLLNIVLKETEQRLGRQQNAEKLVTIDLDLLLYDNQKYHLKDWDRSYIKDLLEEL